MPDGPDSRRIDEVLDDLFEVTRRVHHAVSAVAVRHDLTPQQVMVLRMVSAPVSMRVIADGLSCDPSNVTGLVDRIERLGLVERIPDPDDRRVRMLTLTAEGRRIRDIVNRELARELTE